ncbi:unnamed protein product [Effrenium voratum]|nr:unnamed protein product [Effrenium voratum]
MIVNLAVILTVNQNLQIIDIGLSDTQFSPTAILMYRKQQAYFRFRAAFYLMFLRPTIVAWLHLTVLRGNTEWLVFGLSQVLALVVYLLLLDGLRPTTDKRGLMKLWRSEVRSRSRSPRPAGLEAPAAAGTNLGAQTEPTEEAAIPELATPYVEF